MKRLNLLLLTFMVTTIIHARSVEIEQSLDYGAFELIFSIKFKITNFNQVPGGDFERYYDTYIQESFIDYYNKIDKCANEENLARLLSMNFIHICNEAGLEIKPKYKYGLYVDSRYELKKEKQYKTRTSISIIILVVMTIFL